MKSLRDFNLKEKKVLLRADFNEPLKNGRIVDDFKIRAVLPTINYLLSQQAKLILLTHLGRPNGKVVEELRVDPIGQRISELINQPVKKLDDCLGLEVKKEIDKMKAGEIILLENVQFHPGEKEKSAEYIRGLAELADFLVMDAFGQAHRDYASISGLPRELPSCAGFLLEKEINILTKVLEKPESPLAVIIGGAKISTKIRVIKNFLEKADNILLGGALANTVLSAKGIAIGKSITEEEMVEEVKKLNLTDTKLHIPVDVIVSVDSSGRTPARVAPVGKTKTEEMILDIGSDTVNIFSRIISQAKTIIWNGPMGLFEVEKFACGSNKIARAVAESKGYSVVGGGDSITLLSKLNLLDKIDHLSSGGGAMLKFLNGEKLPGIEALKK